MSVVRGIGSVMYLTTDRIIVARDGRERRPRSGIQSFPLERIKRVRIELGSGTSGRIVVWAEGDLEAVSMFFEPKSREGAEELVSLARAAVVRSRRLAGESTQKTRRQHV